MFQGNHSNPGSFPTTRRRLEECIALLVLCWFSATMAWGATPENPSSLSKKVDSPESGKAQKAANTSATGHTIEIPVTTGDTIEIPVTTGDTIEIPVTTGDTIEIPVTTGDTIEIPVTTGDTLESDSSNQETAVASARGQNPLVANRVDPLTGHRYLVGNFGASFSLDGFLLEHRGQSDVFLLKFDEEKRLQWAVSWGGPAADAAVALHIDVHGQVVVAGHFEDRIHFGHRVLKSDGNRDIFFAGVDPDGKVAWLRRLGGTGDDLVLDVLSDSDGGWVVRGGLGYYLHIEDTHPLKHETSRLFDAAFDEGGHLKWLEMRD